MDFSAGEVQTMIFLKLLIAGHMTIYLTRNVGTLWQKPLPNWIMFTALESTQVIGTLFAVYGWIITPIGWNNALIVWAYAIVWLLLLSWMKVIAYKILNKFESTRITSHQNYMQ